MGYTTQFEGTLKFTKDLIMPELRKLKTFLGEDCREHAEWGHTDLTYIDLKLMDDFSGLEWDGSEKTYELPEKINLIITEMKKDFPDFELTGELLAQGEDVGDVYKIVMIENKAVIKEMSEIIASILQPEAKDYKRIDDMAVNAGIVINQDIIERMKITGQKMANSITNPEKAQRRGLAAKHRGYAELAEIFFIKAKELGYK